MIFVLVSGIFDRFGGGVQDGMRCRFTLNNKCFCQVLFVYRGFTIRGTAAGNKSCGGVMLSVWRELLHGTVTRNSGCRGVMLSVGSGLLRGAVTGNCGCGGVILLV